MLQFTKNPGVYITYPTKIFEKIPGEHGLANSCRILCSASDESGSRTKCTHNTRRSAYRETSPLRHGRGGQKTC